MVAELVAELLDTVKTDRVLDALAEVAAFDRYQASAGIEQAADLVAARAEAAGLSEVGIQRFRADGKAQWWTFEAPTSWTPTVARIAADGFEVDHARQPFALATHSAALTGKSLPVKRPGEDVRGSIVALDAVPSTFRELEQAGALGFVTDGPARRAGYRGRIELPADTGLAGFSLLPEEFATLPGRVDVDVRLGPEASMPVVSGLLPGEGDGEVWLMAHLCHPRPGANDNASGVAALLGVAEALAGTRNALGIRFIWGPEFTGTAAVLHQAGRLPEAVLNLDMVGQDQQQCGAPFVVERPPDYLPPQLAAVAELVVAETFAQTAEHPGTWEPAQFAGFSDHALFADPAIGRPAVQFCHPADRFNHTAADSLDKVAPVEMLRSTAAAAAVARLAAGRYAGVDLTKVLERWHHKQNAPARADGEPKLVRKWEGPLNVRAMLAAASPSTQDAVGALVAADKANLSLIFNLGIRITGRRSGTELAEAAGSARLRPVDPDTAAVLLSAFEDAGWAEAV
ncbi:DUF4910 domain-containing protein [Amycolatopsis sp. WGS_07]|uniref:DUF4910 domain-containing protein n=1 Tax=Amycolatopsis sp. WGS_07 TaxID=3076764 RepID=UPI00387352FB